MPEKPFKIPNSIFHDMTVEELQEMCRNGGYLLPRFKERYWRSIDVQNPPDDEIQVLLNRTDVERVFPPRKK